jgi:CHAT domain-containing protein
LRDQTPHFVAVDIPRAELLARVQRLAALAGKPDSSLKALRREARWLHARLIEPALPWLADSPRLLWVPDAELSLLPLALLRDAQGRHLVETHALRQTTSLTASMLARRHPDSRVARELLAVADPQLAALEGAAAESWRGASIQALGPLPGAALEARSIARLYPGRSTLLRGADATERRVRDLAPTARRLHFAVHGLIDPLRPLDSALVLAAGDGSEADDGLLRAVDLLTGPPLAADLVAVAACDLGGGRVDAAEGLIGLRHALRAAGAREVVSSLWPVGDRSGARLMTDFHAQLRNDTSTDQALQRAQLAMLRADAASAGQARGVGGVVVQRGSRGPVHPFHWAGFVLDGTLE